MSRNHRLQEAPQDHLSSTRTRLSGDFWRQLEAHLVRLTVLHWIKQEKS